MANGDFHLHSSASDGMLAPAALIRRAHEQGVSVLCLSDHDTDAGMAEAWETARGLGIRIIPGMELSTDLEMPGHDEALDIHILAYGIDTTGPAIGEFMFWQHNERAERAKRSVAELRAQGLDVELERVFQIAAGGSVGRPHIARALMERGYVASVQEAFNTWLADGMPAAVPRRKLPPAQLIDLVHSAGGRAFLAHPFRGGIDDAEVPNIVETMVEIGLDGIETYYKHYDEGRIADIRAMAAKFGLALSGGSDFHGLGNPDDREIGDIPFPSEAVDDFIAYIEANTARPYIEEGVHA